MGFSSKLWFMNWKWLVAAATVVAVSVAKGDDPPPPLVPAICISGDSVVDVGNYNHLLTLVKANFPPYGRDFVTHSPTGRFSNGKLAIDFIAEFLGFTSYQPAYLSQEATGTNILIGANFASAASGYSDTTADLFTTTVYKVISQVGRNRATTIFSKTIHLLSARSCNFIQNYYINPLLNHVYTLNQFSDILIQCYSTFIENLSGLGAPRMGVTSLPPAGCLPAAITLFGLGSNQCVERVNHDAVSFNSKA